MDIGFTGLAKEVMKSYKEDMLNDVLEVCENTQNQNKNHQYVWTMPSWLLWKTLEGLSEEKRERVEDLIKRGQLTWHALPFTTHTEFCGVEDYIRGLYFSKQLSQRFNKKVISAKMTDVPGHTWMLPSILYKAGIRFLHLGCNACSTPPDVPRLFFWEGPDGNRVLTYYSKGEYGTDLLPPDDWDHSVWLALQQTHDNGGPQSDEIVENILAEVNEKSPDTNVVFGAMDDFAQAMLQRDLSDIPVIKKDLADTWIHGVGTYPEEVSKIRRKREEITVLETIGTINKLLGIWDTNRQNSYFDILKQTFENALLFGEHTWGLDMKITLLPLYNGVRRYEKNDFLEDKQTSNYQRAEASWNEQRHYVGQVERNIDALKQYHKDPDQSNNEILIYNPLPWERQHEEITLESGSNGYVLDLVTDEKAPIHHSQDNSSFIANKIPALGYKKYQLLPEEPLHIDIPQLEMASFTENGVMLQNEWISLVVDESTGVITSLYDRKNQKEWVSPYQEVGFGGYTYNVYGKEAMLKFMKDYAYDLTDWYVNDFGKAGYPRVSGREYAYHNIQVSVENRPSWGQIQIEACPDPESYQEFGNAKSIKCTISLNRHQRMIDITYDLMEKEESPFAEGGYFSFPLNASNPEYRIQKMGAVINPLIDVQKDANMHFHSLDKWIDVTDDDGTGISFIPIDTPLVSIDKKGVYQFSSSFTPKEPILHFNAFNNQWGTNFPQWIGGSFQFQYKIYVHEGNWNEGEVWKVAEESHQPLYPVQQPEQRETYHDYSFLKEEESGIRILTFKPSEDREGYILRIQDIKGESRPVQFSIQEEFDRVMDCDVLETDDQELPYRDGKVHFDLNSFEVKTLKLYSRKRSV